MISLTFSASFASDLAWAALIAAGVVIGVIGGGGGGASFDSGGGGISPWEW